MSQQSSLCNARVEVYTRYFCSFCTRAKSLLDDKHVTYAEYVIIDPAEREKMIERARGRYTYPQIFINDEPIGGFTDLLRLQMDGELDALLSDEGDLRQS